jgi:hypothetical protein
MIVLQSIFFGIIGGVIYALVSYHEKLMAARREFERKNAGHSDDKSKRGLAVKMSLLSVLRILTLVVCIGSLLYVEAIVPLPFTASFILSFIGSMYYLVKRPF